MSSKELSIEPYSENMQIFLFVFSGRKRQINKAGIREFLLLTPLSSVLLCRIVASVSVLIKDQ